MLGVVACEQGYCGNGGDGHPLISRSPTSVALDDPIDDRPQDPHRIDHQEFLDQALHQVDADLLAIFVLREIEELSLSRHCIGPRSVRRHLAFRLNRARRELRFFTSTLEE